MEALDATQIYYIEVLKVRSAKWVSLDGLKVSFGIIPSGAKEDPFPCLSQM